LVWREQDLFHWFRTFLKVIFTIAAAFTGIGLLAFAIAICTSGPWNAVVGLCTKYMPERNGKDAVNISFSLALLFFILSTELEIRWNHISGVQSIRGTGQILPIVVAGAALVRVLWKGLLSLCTGEYEAQPQRTSEQLNPTTAGVITSDHQSGI
jgi:hypothetical protein